MSPSSSSLGRNEGSAQGPAAGGHSRNNSAAISAEPPSLSRPPTSPSISASNKPVHYTVFIRLPFRRHDFENPLPVDWDATKDHALWKIISKANSKDLDWQEISARFEVSLSFLLQQAAYLYERHFEAMRTQMKRLGAGPNATGSGAGSSGSGSGAGPQIDGATGSGSAAGGRGVAMQRTGSRESKAQISSTSTTKRNAPLLSVATDVASAAPPLGSGTPRSAKPPISRTPSTATVTQSRVFTSSTANTLQRARQGTIGSSKRPSHPQVAAAEPPAEEDPIEATTQASDSPSDPEDQPNPLTRSRFPQRPTLGKKSRPPLDSPSSDGDAEGDEGDDDDDDDEDSSSSYLPFAAATNGPKEDPAATLRENLQRNKAPVSRPNTAKTKPRPEAPSASHTTESSASSMSRHFSSDGGNEQQPRPNAISPQHRTLAGLSPRSRTHGSEGSPSMGSSFSDLDDISQSALDDAVLSNMRQGGSSMASRVSSLRDALARRG